MRTFSLFVFYRSPIIFTKKKNWTNRYPFEIRNFAHHFFKQTLFGLLIEMWSSFISSSKAFSNHSKNNAINIVRTNFTTRRVIVLTIFWLNLVIFSHKIFSFFWNKASFRVLVNDAYTTFVRSYGLSRCKFTFLL